MRDFTLSCYKYLLIALKSKGYAFKTFEEYLASRGSRTVILRHDVDNRPGNSLKFAETEHSLGIRSSYHFRKDSLIKNPGLIRQIAAMGHEISYHYEDLSCIARHRKPGEAEIKQAIGSFRLNLAEFRKIFPVRVISMHGDPLSATDNRMMWKLFDYKTEGVICEPYFDIDYSSVLYITDTGRKWNSRYANLRDNPGGGNHTSAGRSLSEFYNFRNTHEIINNALEDKLPDYIIINTHPQRWTDNISEWLAELIWQNIKNLLKVLLSVSRRIAE